MRTTIFRERIYLYFPLKWSAKDIRGWVHTNQTSEYREYESSNLSFSFTIR